jgi:hypothetical protein
MARDFDGVNDKITTGYAGSPRIRGFSLWTYRRSNGGGGAGRMIDMTDGYEVVTFVNSLYLFIRNWSSTDGQWSIPAPSINTWHHLVITYDAGPGGGSTTNDPVIWLNGVQQSITEEQTPVGAIEYGSGTVLLGNNQVGDRAWDGAIAGVMCHEGRLLTQEDVNILYAAGPAALGWIPTRFWELWGVGTVEPESFGGPAITTFAGTTRADHPPRQAVWRRPRRLELTPPPSVTANPWAVYGAMRARNS